MCRPISSLTKPPCSFLVQVRTFCHQLLARFVHRDLRTAVDPLLALRCGPVHRIAQYLPNDRVKVNRVGFVSRPKIENLAVAAFPDAAAAKHFATFEPG